MLWSAMCRKITAALSFLPRSSGWCMVLCVLFCKVLPGSPFIQVSLHWSSGFSEILWQLSYWELGVQMTPTSGKKQIPAL